MSFPVNDNYWVETADFLKLYVKDSEPLIAPNDFLDEFAGTYPPRCLKFLQGAVNFRWAVIHKGEIAEMGYSLLEQITREFIPVFANKVFVVFSRDSKLVRLPNKCLHLQAFWQKMKQLEKKSLRRPDKEYKSSNKIRWCGIVVNTYNRPNALNRSLPQIISLGAAVIVIDDGSEKNCYEQNLRIAESHNVPLLRVPSNRGFPCARNVGICYWLADPEIEWISCFEDDVDVHPDLLSVMAKIQDSKVRPLCTGHDAYEHPAHEKVKIEEHVVIMKRSCRSVHLHAHRDYWLKVMPIPTPYLGAPKADKGILGQGSDTDWWIASWSPDSVVKQGTYVTCVPGLVRIFLHKAKDSTWKCKLLNDHSFKES